MAAQRRDHLKPGAWGRVTGATRVDGHSSAHAAEGLDLPEIIPVCDNNEDFIKQVSLLLQNEDLARKVGAEGLNYIKENYASGLVSK